MSGPISITSTSQFDTLTKSNTYVIVDFYADWCGPCKMIAPVFASLASAESKPGRLAFCKVDVDSQRDIASRFGVSAMPTFLVLKGSTVTETIRGANASALRTAVLRAAGDAAKRPSKGSGASFGQSGRTLGATGSAPAARAGGAGINIGANAASLAQGLGTGFLDQIIRFFALYLTTLFSLHADTAAKGSPFALPEKRQ